jgi:two-component system repressor protein LuxO
MRVPRILIIEDVPSLAATYSSYLAREGYELLIAASGAEALTMIERFLPEVIVLDVHLPDMDGLHILRQMKSRQIPTETVVMTSQGSVNLAVQAMQEGAFDFVLKPFTPDRIRVTIRNALEKRKLSNKVQEIDEEFGRESFVGFVGRSMAMQTVYRILQSAAPSNATVFITGESGTGKELCADALHKLGPRSKGPFVAINSAAIPRDLLESELFGHVKGAFTGATSDRKGAAQAADGGTLFLDEICEMDLGMQAKILRFLQTRSVQRVGEEVPRPVDVRVVCATNRDPQVEMAAGRFREDLFYRLHVVPVELPPLREREDDILLIARVFLKQFSAEDRKNFKSFSADVEQMLLAFPWPGNVRQLQNVIRNIVVLNEGPVVRAEMVPREVRSPAVHAQPAVSPVEPENVGSPAAFSPFMADAPQPNARVAAIPEVRPLEAIIRETIESTIARFGGSVPRAAAALEIAPSTIYRRMQEWNS